MARTITLAAVAAIVLAPVCVAQSPAAPDKDSTRAGKALPVIVVTATRTPKLAFDAPAAVNYLGADVIRTQMPNTAADLFREQPGLDVNGVGTNQARPSIRGQRGQRILLLEDGIRMNNSRRQQDFGELPALVSTADVERVEVVRGPASVLYGTDAIGGVLNIITKDVPASDDRRLHGTAAFSYGTADVQRRSIISVSERLGNVAFRLSGNVRKTSPYSAPRGQYGQVTLSQDERVNDTGVDDNGWSGLVSYDLTEHQRVSAKFEHYSARNAGFGYVEPSVIGPDQPLIRIRYPDQDVSKYSLRYSASAPGNLFADKVSLTGYGVDNARHLAMNIFVPFGPGTPPGAGVQSNSANFTRMATIGFRAEATKILERQQLTYGVDGFRDRSDNTDSSVTTVLGFGPPRPSVSTAPQVPDATFSSIGAFVQNDVRLADRISVILGARAQDVNANTRPLSGSPTSSHDRTVVGTASTVVHVTSDVNLIASVAHGFRSPNLVERFFDGPTPEGSGYQRSSPNLRAETSRNVDVGARYRRGVFSAEAFLFQNDVRDGIRIAPTGDSVGRMPAFRNVNVDRLRFSGAELESATLIGTSIFARANYTRLRSHNVLDPISAVGTSYSTKTVGEIGYRDPDNRLSLSYVLRRNGRQSDQQIGTNPIGSELPAFTVQSVRGSLSLFDGAGLRGTLHLALENLANTLYAEAANASFFRPQPGRNLLATWSLEF